jgi:hypothetical protein
MIEERNQPQLVAEGPAVGEPLRVVLAVGSSDDATAIVDRLREGGFDPYFIRVETPVTFRRQLATKSWDAIIADYACRRSARSGRSASCATSGSICPSSS